MTLYVYGSDFSAPYDRDVYASGSGSFYTLTKPSFPLYGYDYVSVYEPPCAPHANASRIYDLYARSFYGPYGSFSDARPFYVTNVYDPSGTSDASRPFYVTNVSDGFYEPYGSFSDADAWSTGR